MNEPSPSPSVPVESREQPSHVIELVNNGNHGWECSCGVSAYSPGWSPSSAEDDSYSHYPQADPDHPMTQLRAQRDRARDLAAHLEEQLARLAECPQCHHPVSTHWPNRENRPTTACIICLDAQIKTESTNGLGYCCYRADLIPALAAHLEAEQAEETK